MQKIAVGPDGADVGYTEAVMKAWQSQVWSWNIDGLSLHSYTVGKWPPSYKSTGFGEAEYAALIKETLRMEELIRTHSAIMDLYDPEKKIALVVDEWGVWLAPTPGTNPGFLEQQNSQRDAMIAAEYQHLRPPRRSRAHGQRRADGECAAGDDPHRRRRMVLTPTYHVFRMYLPFQDATAVPISFAAGWYVYGNISLPRLDAIAAREKNGKLWLALTNVDPKRTASVEVMAAASGRPPAKRWPRPRSTVSTPSRSRRRWHRDRSSSHRRAARSFCNCCRTRSPSLPWRAERRAAAAGIGPSME